nr:zinc finger, CCHC-type [Tanacetum cinerariifolium]
MDQSRDVAQGYRGLTGAETNRRGGSWFNTLTISLVRKPKDRAILVTNIPLKITLLSLMLFSIGDGMFNEGNTKAQSIRNPRINLAHRCITMTITGRKETTNRVTKIDLFYLYCIFGEGVVCNIPYWLAKYLKIPPPHVYRKTSLVKMEVIMELHEGEYYWPATRRVMKESKGDDEEGNGEGGNRGVGGSANIYRNMSQGDYHVRQERWMDQQDERQGRIDAWMGQQDERAH